MPGFSFENLLQIDPQLWPVAILAFLRCVSIFFFLPLFGDKGIPAQLRIALGFVMTLCLWGVIEKNTARANSFLQWNALGLAVVTLREVFFGFAVGFGARVLIFGAKISSEMMGLGMGFQTATLFSPDAHALEGPLTALRSWLVIVLLFIFGAHHHFLIALSRSFTEVPLASTPDAAAIAKLAMDAVRTSFVLGVQLAAPVLVIQFLVSFGMGLLNRVIPQLNAFILSFPLSFGLSLLVLFLSAATFVRFVGGPGVYADVKQLSAFQRAFAPPR